MEPHRGSLDTAPGCTYVGVQVDVCVCAPRCVAIDRTGTIHKDIMVVMIKPNEMAIEKAKDRNESRTTNCISWPRRHA